MCWNQHINNCEISSDVTCWNCYKKGISTEFTEEISKTCDELTHYLNQKAKKRVIFKSSIHVHVISWKKESDIQ